MNKSITEYVAILSKLLCGTYLHYMLLCLNCFIYIIWKSGKECNLPYTHTHRYFNINLYFYSILYNIMLFNCISQNAYLNWCIVKLMIGLLMGLTTKLHIVHDSYIIFTIKTILYEQQINFI